MEQEELFKKIKSQKWDCIELIGELLTPTGTAAWDIVLTKYGATLDSKWHLGRETGYTYETLQEALNALQEYFKWE